MVGGWFPLLQLEAPWRNNDSLLLQRYIFHHLPSYLSIETLVDPSAFVLNAVGYELSANKYF